jgi:hypothetical protein
MPLLSGYRHAFTAGAGGLKQDHSEVTWPLTETVPPAKRLINASKIKITGCDKVLRGDQLRDVYRLENYGAPVWAPRVFY